MGSLLTMRFTSISPCVGNVLWQLWISLSATQPLRSEFNASDRVNTRAAFADPGLHRQYSLGRWIPKLDEF